MYNMPRLVQHEERKIEVMVVRVPAGTKERIETAAAQAGVNISEWIRRAIEDRLRRSVRRPKNGGRSS